MNEVTILDKSLRKAINEMLEKPYSYEGAFTEDELSCLKTLTIVEKDIESISGLEYAKNLKSLNLSNNKIVDLSPISSLENLRCLNLSHNYILNIDSLANLKNLTYLNISDNQIMNLDILSSLNELVFLDVSYNQICNLTSLKTLPKLSISLADNQKIGLLTQRVNFNGEFTISLDLLKNRYGITPSIEFISDNGIYNIEENSVSWINLTKSKEYNFTFKSEDGFLGDIVVRIEVCRTNVL